MTCSSDPLHSLPTWHTPHPPVLPAVTEETETPASSQTEAGSSGGNSVYGRRNPWGNQSYADLITQAISSGHDRRMTLSQIYDWMVANIPNIPFTDRQSNSKSAGWKVKCDV